MPHIFFCFMRFLLPVTYYIKGGWRVRSWVYDTTRSRFWCDQLLLRIDANEQIWINPNDSMGRHMFLRGVWEKPVVDHFLSNCHNGDTILDIGANMGQYSLLGAKKVGAAGRVVAVEVNAKCFDLLKKNVEMCQPTPVDILAVAAWSENTKIRLMDGADTTTGLAQITMNADEEGHEVIARRLDDVLLEIGLDHADVVKLDIEGAELPALKGMANILKESPPSFIYCEIEDKHCRQFSYTPADLFDYLTAFGFELFAFCRDDGGVVPLDSSININAYSNMFLFKLSA